MKIKKFKIFPSFSRKAKRRITIVAVTMIVVLGPLALSIILSGNKASAAWFNDNFGYRKSIAISTHTAAENNVYISVTLSNTDTLVTDGQLQSSCQDMRFTKQGGELLPYYIVSGCNSASTVVHIYFKTFPAGAQTIYFYYGNPTVGAGGQSAGFTTEAASYTIGATGSEEKKPSPVGYWKFDDATGTNANDTTSNNNDGTLSGSTLPTWQTEDQCISGKCLFFDGSNSYVTLGNPTALQITSNITVSAWIKPTSLPTSGNYAIVLEKGYNGTTESYTLQLANRSGTQNIEFYSYDGTIHGVQWAKTLTTGTWYHLVGTWDGTNWKVYLDGVLGSTTADATGPLSTAKNVSVGAGDINGSISRFFPGFIDEVKVDNYVRTADQIKSDYNARSNMDGAASVVGQTPNNIPAALNNGLIGYWKMDEASWTNNCSAASVLDSSGNANNGKSCPNPTGPTGGAVGKFGNAGSFDGNNDYVDTSNFFNQASGNHTYAAWVNPTNTLTTASSTVNFLDKTQATSNLEFNWTNNRGLCMYFYSFTDYYTCYSTTLTAGTWYHIAATQDGFDIKLFLNGALVATGSTSPNGVATNNVTFQIARRAVADQYFPGSIDEVRVYNRALSPADVSQLYNFAPGPVAYYNFEENTGSTVNDRSGNANTGTWNGSGSPHWKPGKYGAAGNFDGSTDYVSVSNSNSVNVYGSSITIETWAKFTDLSATRFLVEKDNAGATKQYYFWWNTNGNLTAGYHDGAAYRDYTYAFTPTLERWYHLAWTSDGTWIRIFVDGINVSTQSQTGSIISSSGGIEIGKQNRGEPRMQGYLDDLKIYNYTRTQQQIVEDMTNGSDVGGSGYASANSSTGGSIAKPVGYWRFDEGYGTTANNVGNGGSALNGTLTGMSSPATSTSGWTQAGKVSRGLVFDGSNDYVAMPSDVTALKITSSITLSAWINLTNTSSQHDIICKYTGTASTSAYCLFTDTSGKLNMSVVNATGPTIVTTTGNKVLSTSTWYHVVGVFDSANSVTLYINGVQDKQSTTSIPTTLQNPTTILDIGAENAGSNLMTGVIDEPKVYNYALTAEQVKMDMNQGSALVLGSTSNNSSYQPQAANQEYCVPGDTTSCTAPVGRWDFEEGSGTSVNDSSGNGLIGTWAGTGSHWANGKYGKTGKFNGTDDYVNMGDTSIMDFGSGNFTLQAWVKLGSLTQTRGLIIAKDNSGGSGRQFALEWDGDDNNSNDIRIGYFKASDAQVWLDTSNNIITDLKWHHIVAGRSGSSFFVYIDGLLKSSGNTFGSHGSMQATTSHLRIGNRQYSGATDELNGSIDQVRIYNYARSAAQVAWDYNKGAPVGHWRMDECQGAIANDSSGTINGSISIGASGSQTAAGTCQTSSTAWGNGVTGKRNYSLNFDGTDDRVSFTVPAAFNLASGGGMTLSAWIKTSTDGRGILMLQNSNPLIYLQVGSTTNGGTANKFVAYIRDDTGTVQAIPINGTTTVTDNNWHHVIFVIDNTNLYLYVDGRRETSTTWGGGSVTTAGATGYIGDIFHGSFNWEFSGQIDDVRIHNYALTTTQVKNLFNDGAANYGPVTGAP